MRVCGSYTCPLYLWNKSADQRKTPQYYVPKPLERVRINDTWKLIFQYVPFLLKFLRALVFILLETTLREFSFSRRPNSAREKSRAKSQNYVRETAPSEF